MVGVQGSALNKWAKGNETRRDMFTKISTSPPVDMSDGKGIYNLTIKTNEELDPPEQSDFDMGEEVYGCIVSGYAKNQGNPKIEYSAQEAIANRRERKDCLKEEGHFSAVGRIWATKEKDGSHGTGCVDSVCIPTENIPLVANSKFAIKYWQEGEEPKMIEIPKGAGFTSGTLVRPLAFSTKAGEIRDGALAVKINTAVMRSHTLKAVPIKTAHAILNRCKEISLTGSVNYSVERTNKECSGVKTSKYEYEEEVLSGDCPPATCLDVGASTTLSCLSTKLTTKVLLAGNIDMTAYRYKQLTDIWGEEPETLDISGNHLDGRSAKKVGYMKLSQSYCEDDGSSVAIAVPLPQVEQITDFEKQEKLSSGCLTYPSTNQSMLHATLEDNLKTKELSLANCITSSTSYNLDTYYNNDSKLFWNYYSNNMHPSGVTKLPYGYMGNAICPEFASGPSLRAYFMGNGWDFSGVGTDGPQDAYSIDCKKTINNFYNYKGEWRSTGLTRTIVSGKCPLGIKGLGRYDGDTKSVGDCKCDDSCESCKKNFGEVRLLCDCQPMCAPELDYSGGMTVDPCDGDAKTKCDGIYSIHMEIGKYVGYETYPEQEVHNTSAIPLSTKMDTKTEDLILWWTGAFIQPDGHGDDFESPRALPFYLNQASAKGASPPDNSLVRYDNKEIGTLVIKCDDWSIETPLWGVFRIDKETTCKGTASPTNAYSTSKDAGAKYCNGCNEAVEDCGGDCTCCSASGCGGVSSSSNGCCNTEPCGIDDPCKYSVQAESTIKCDPSPSCSGGCVDDEVNDGCGCCNCDYDGDCDPCPQNPTCKAFKVISDYEEMGCYGDAHEEDKHEASVNLTLEFKLFTEME